MSKDDQALELIVGYAKGLITDSECTSQFDLITNEISVIDGNCWDHETDEWVPKNEYLKNN
tara:strand:- start:51 stop:233 length:183 start_codon:yes stop_codon:yes gene_type:complete